MLKHFYVYKYSIKYKQIKYIPRVHIYARINAYHVTAQEYNIIEFYIEEP